MKKIILLLLLISLTSCITYDSGYIRNIRKSVAIKDTVDLYEYESDGSVGEKVKRVPASMLKNSDLYGYRIRSFSPMFNTVSIEKDTFFVSYEDVMDLKNFNISLQSTQFTSSIKDKSIYWSRAITYITRHSSMKIQMSNENLIECFNPISASDISFSVTCQILSDSLVSYTVNSYGCMSALVTGSRGLCTKIESPSNARKLAYYMINNEE